MCNSEDKQGERLATLEGYKMKNIKVIFAICKAKELQRYLDMSNQDIEVFGHVTVLELLCDCVETGSVVEPFRNKKEEVC